MIENENIHSNFTQKFKSEPLEYKNKNIYNLYIKLFYTSEFKQKLYTIIHSRCSKLLINVQHFTWKAQMGEWCTVVLNSETKLKIYTNPYLHSHALNNKGRKHAWTYNKPIKAFWLSQTNTPKFFFFGGHKSSSIILI